MSITGDAFDIKIDPGNGQEPQPIFKVDPSWITSKKSFFDMQGNHQFDLKKEYFHLVHEYMKLVDAEGNKFCEVKKNVKRKSESFIRTRRPRDQTQSQRWATPWERMC